MEGRRDVNYEISHCLSLGYRQLEDYAGENYQKIYYYIKDVKNNVNPNHVLVGTIFTAIASDGKFNDDEWKFISSFVGGFSHDEAYDTAGSFFSEEAQRIAEDLANSFPYEIKEAYVKLCIAVLAVDNRVDGNEVGFLKRLL